MIKVGIVGNRSDIIAELLGLLINHPDAEIVFVDSEEYNGKKISDIYRRLYGDTDLSFTDKSPLDIIDVLFCCNTAGGSFAYMRETSVPKSLKIIDLSPDFRLPSEDNLFEYGLPELNRRATCSSRFVANPGAIATCVGLSLLPLAKNLLLNNPICVNIIGGDSVFGDDIVRNDILSYIKLRFDSEYQEVKYSLLRLQNSFEAEVNVIPVHVMIPRGIMVNVLTEVKVDLNELKSVYSRYYEEDSFTFLMDNPVLGDVLNTNKCLIGLSELNGKLLITCCIDDLIKGCAGQAVHNMNLMFNLEETTGLLSYPSVAL